jgi:ABC-type protease/lipase transport system fused ATPase/permease subunit
MLETIPSPKSAGKAVDAPVRKILQQCRQAFGLVFLMTVVIDFLSIVPMVYMLNVMDRVLSSRSGVTLVSLTVLVLSLIHI